MKKIALFYLILLALTTRALSQNTDGELQKSPTCFFVSHLIMESNKTQISKTFCIGDKIKVTLKDNHSIKGTLDHISRDNRIIVDGIEIDVSTIQSFERAGLNSGAAIVGGLLVAGGAALIISAHTTNLDLESGPGKLVIGIFSVVGGLVTLTSHAKFKTEKDDKWIYNH
jgi:hypothetical protein